MCSNVQDWACAIGFGPFLSLPVLQVDRALLMALTERWSPVTHTFHLPVGEIRMPPIDFFMMTGFSMDGTPPLSSDDFDPKLAARCIGPQPVAYYKGRKGALPSWFEKDYVWATNQSMLEEIAFSTRAFLVYMLTRSIFCGKSDRIYFYLLSVLEELDLVDTRSWGRSALGWMYSNISDISLGRALMPSWVVFLMGGMAYLISVIYVHLHFFI